MRTEAKLQEAPAKDDPGRAKWEEAACRYWLPQAKSLAAAMARRVCGGAAIDPDTLDSAAGITLWQVVRSHENEGGASLKTRLARRLSGEVIDVIRGLLGRGGEMAALTVGVASLSTVLPGKGRETTLGDTIPAREPRDSGSPEDVPLLSRLRSRQRHVLWRRLVEGASVAELARELRVCESMVSLITREAINAVRAEAGLGPVMLKDLDRLRAA